MMEYLVQKMIGPIGDIYLNFVNVSMIPNNIITPIDAPIITFGDMFCYRN